MSHPIPKIIHQLWIGPIEPPTEWMASWGRLNPEWEYRLWDNDAVFSRKWRNQKIIDHYLKACRLTEKTGEFQSAQGSTFKGEKATLFAWHVISDIVRYELLHECGGYHPGADSVCISPIGDFFEGMELYTVRTGWLYEAGREKLLKKLEPGGAGLKEKIDFVRLRRYDHLHASPILASTKGHPFLDAVIVELGKKKKSELGEAVDTTGNCFMAHCFRKFPELLGSGFRMPKFQTVSNNGLPEDHSSFSVHMSGTTHNRYHLGRKESKTETETRRKSRWG
jgi:hypothetical protein